MAVTEVELTWTGQTGSTDDTGGKKFAATFIVTVDSPSDGAQVVLGAQGVGGFTDTLVTIGDAYAFGNDADSDAVCDSLRPTRFRETRLRWKVTAGWATPGSTQSGTDSSGNQTSDPLEFRDDLSIEFAKVSEPVYKAILRTAGLGGAFAQHRRREPGGGLFNVPPMAAGKELPVMSTAGEVLDPPLEKDHTLFIFRRTTSRAAFLFEDATEYSGAINADDFTFTIPGKTAADAEVYTAKKYTALADNFGGVYHFANGIFYWRFRYELIIDPKGWRVDVLNQGFQQYADSGVWTGRVDDANAKILWTDTDFPPGSLKARRVRIPDHEGRGLPKPSNLDNDGLPQGDGVDPLFITWSKLDELPFTGHALFA